ncbi:QRFP-like peptide receptor [Ptychodera flava]|uniref:QRFP-like peptide receptor n=1 Tax=Ptychodera flava TaxID=63121 RepID=UPI003969E195
METNSTELPSDLDWVGLFNETSDEWTIPGHWYVHKSIIYTLYGLCIFLIVTGNLMVIIAVLMEPKLRRAPTNILIASLAVSDLLVGSYYIPSVIMWDEALHLMLNPTICNIDGFIQLTSTGASVFSLIAIASDRFRAIVTPLKPKINRCQACIMAAIAWACAMSYASYMPITRGYLMYTETSGNETYVTPYCIFLPHVSFKLVRTLDFFVLFVVPFLILSCLYAPMVYKLWFDKQPASSTGYKKKNAVKTLSMVVILFFTMWLPHYTLYLYVQYGDFKNTRANLRAVALFAICLNFSNSWVNPIIYACFNENFRCAFKNTLLCKIWRISRRVYPISDPESEQGDKNCALNDQQPVSSRNTMLTTANTTCGQSIVSTIPAASGAVIPHPSPTIVPQKQHLLSPNTYILREDSST